MMFVQLLLIGLVLATWARLVTSAWRGLRSGRPLIEHHPKAAVRWGAIDLGMGAVILVLTLTLAARGLIWIYPELTGDGGVSDRLPQLSAPQQISVLLVSKLTELAGVVLVVAWIVSRTGADGVDFGVRGGPTRADFWHGARIFGLLVVPVYALMFLLQQAVPEDFVPRQHPILQMIEDSQRPALLLAGIFPTIVLLAPLTEEFVFRVLLQGWFQNIDFAARTRQWWLGTRGPQEIHALSGRLQADTAANQRVDDRVPSWWPIASSAVLFSVAHLGHGLDPIPLFVLSLGIGYLFARTGRYWPCFVVHMLNNGLSFVMMCLVVSSQGIPA
jgi:membrane protease YdiL (CAAX protease family)